MEHRALRVIISGGGTGGHIFPALSIADKLKETNPQTEILFVGANGRMEMEKVPARGYRIIGLDVAGLQRRLALSNLTLPFKVIGSVRKAGKIIRDFKPDVAVGVGGYASAPLLWSACSHGIPTLIQEQNGFAGLTNRILGKRADRICVAYEGMDRFFPSEKIVMTGNPIRPEIMPATDAVREEAISHFGLTPGLRHIFIVGGSLGSRTLNEAVKSWIAKGCPSGDNIEIIWQCGKYYKADTDRFMKEAAENGIGGEAAGRIRHYDFINRMDLAYAAADLVISRSGASSISELCAMGKAVIFVPSPNVAEDHQRHNALALVNRDAALMITDNEAPARLMDEACTLVNDGERIASLERNILKMAKADAAGAIAEEIYKLAR